MWIGVLQRGMIARDECDSRLGAVYTNCAVSRATMYSVSGSASADGWPAGFFAHVGAAIDVRASEEIRANGVHELGIGWANGAL